MIPDLQLNNFVEGNNGVVALSIERMLSLNHSTISLAHRTSYYQVYLVMKGEGSVWIDAQEYRCEQGTMFSISKGQIGLINFDKNIQGYVIFFSEEYVYRYPEDIGWINNLKLFDYSTSPMVQLTERELLELVNLQMKIEFESKTKSDFAKDEIILNLLKTFLLVAERNKRKIISENSSESKYTDYIIAFRNKLEEHYRISHSVNFYANQLNVTPRKLNQVISNHFGKPTKKIIEERILLESKRLLAHTECTVKEIGNSLGFTDPTNFNKFFRKFSNTTPADFRSSIKTVNHNKTALSNHS
jgi:AraC family transcriptional regulator, transcriptional activator of pobA